MCSNFSYNYFITLYVECTHAGILKMVTSQTLPFWWDDVSDFNTLEGLVVQTFNQVIIFDRLSRIAVTVYLQLGESSVLEF